MKLPNQRLLKVRTETTVIPHLLGTTVLRVFR